MAHFECIKTHIAKQVIERVQVRRQDDTVTLIDKARDVTITPGAYGHEDIKVGKVYEIKGRLAEKARKNTEYFVYFLQEAPNG